MLMKRLGGCSRQVKILLSLTLLVLISHVSTTYAYDEWWDAKWHYRFKIEINSSYYDRANWPIEKKINFTSLLEQLNVSGTFDINSTRLFEYNSDGRLLYEVPSQFDVDTGFNATTNAYGTLVFIMNGTTQTNTKRYYYVYFDIIENGIKEKPSYATNIVYSWNGKEIQVNNTKLRIYIDTNRAENTSGIYKVVRQDGTVIFQVDETERTVEYLEYFNGTHNLTFNLIGNATLRFGPVRLTIEQVGEEVVFGNVSQKTNKTVVVKRYYIYNRAGPETYGTWIKVEQNITNVANESIVRNSTPAGALAIDLERSLFGGISDVDVNTTNPYSWSWGSSPTGELTGIINYDQVGTDNFFATNSSEYGRIGIQLNTTTINKSESIIQTSLIYFGTDATEFMYLVDRVKQPENVTKLAPQTWEITLEARTEHTIYNREEDVLIKVNITRDVYNLTKYVNATFDMGTSTTADDQTIVLYDDGTHGDVVANDNVFTNYFNLTSTSTIGMWNITIRVYDNNAYFLNETWTTFNVTDVLNVTTEVLTKVVYSNDFTDARVFVKNYRKDTWIIGATLICDFNGTNVENITDLNNGTYMINFTAPTTPGIYILNCTASKNENQGFDGDWFRVETVTTSVDITVSPTTYTATQILWNQSETFEIEANATNIGYGTAFDTNITLELPLNWNSNYTLQQCNDVEPGSTCRKAFLINVTQGTPPGNYIINVSVVWNDPQIGINSNTTSINVTVTSNPLMVIPENSVTGTAHHGRESTIGTFTIKSMGNERLLNISFNLTGLEDFVVEFTPTIEQLDAGQEQIISVNVTVPVGYTPGIYNGSVNISTINDGWKNLTLEVTVPVDRTWTMVPDYCEKLEKPDTGLVCEVNISNLGNVYINFTITPKEGNYTEVNETNFTIGKQSYHVFSVFYNVTGVPKEIYNSTFTVNAVEVGANPDYDLLKVSLLPYVAAQINISIKPKVREELKNVEIYVNVSSISGASIQWVRINVTRPDGTVDIENMTLVYQFGSFSKWYKRYPDSWGNTSEWGNYSVVVYLNDSYGVISTANESFYIYPELFVTLYTLSNVYYQGDTGSIYYKVVDANGTPISGTNVTISITNEDDLLLYNESFTANEEGEIVPLPQFTIASDWEVGNYTLAANSYYYENNVSITITDTTSTTFKVEKKTAGGLFADIETAVVWYPESVMTFGITIYDASGQPVDPDTMNLTVYDPAENVYFSVTKSAMIREATGYYTYKYAMPSDTPTGFYLAVLNVTKNELETLKLKAFRVAKGGPYDVRIELLEQEVPRGDYLDFNIIVENKGEVSQDVDLEYWVSDGSQTWYYASEAVHVEAWSNKTLLRSAYIFSNQPTGMYYLNVKVTYDVTQSPIHKNVTFYVIEAVTTTTVPPPPRAPPAPPPAPAPPPPIAPRYDIEIERYPREVLVERGSIKYASIKVRNTGNTNLTNVYLNVRGIKSSWYVVEPRVKEELGINESFIFLIKFIIPRDAERRTYNVIVTAFTKEARDEKVISLLVFTSREELIQYELEKLKKELSDLENATQTADIEGKDVREVVGIITQVKKEIELAEQSLKEKLYDEAITHIFNGFNLIEKGKYLLGIAPFKKFKLPAIPLWVFVVVVIGIIIFFLIGFRIDWLRRKLEKVTRPSVEEARRIAGLVKERKEVERDLLLKEKERVERMLKLLENEYKQGVISEKAYREMKERNMKRLREIEEKLGI